ncbi:hypothetical protein [Clostridium sp. Marseille-Q2269]|uniref:hypothetical protein n=1 Tax=Clostridium sp. Marseille-Q2269 TaxID=2942205 RepID=UPI00207480C0|nr:hypothetical protein [Clostridium sp. Marseille-Q2269]
MFKLDILQMVISIISILVTIIFLSREYLAKKKLGQVIVKRKNLKLMVAIIGTVILFIFMIDYSDFKSINIGYIIHAIFVAICTRQMVSTFSSKYYTIGENGVTIDYGAFFKWEEIDGYEWDYGLLKFKINKLGVIRKIKIKTEDSEKVQYIINENKILAFI